MIMASGSDGAWCGRRLGFGERQRASQAKLDDQEVMEMLERVEDAQATLEVLMDSLRCPIQPRRP